MYDCAHVLFTYFNRVYYLHGVFYCAHGGLLLIPQFLLFTRFVYFIPCSGEIAQCASALGSVNPEVPGFDLEISEILFV